MSSALVGGTDAAASAAQAALVNSSKYRAYVAAVDKALKAFEATNEWADLISALAKLSRVFHTNAKFGDIPKPVTVAKRLSQCLHPALPHGVHLKALETYRQLFDILGRKDLPRLLYLFAVGLFPLMDHCGIKVKSELLNIFEQYLLPLGADLKPALPGFITGVLLGLEEGTEFYDRSFSLLDRVQSSVGKEVFFACLWEAILGSPSVRLPALIYVNAKFDRRKSMEDQLYIMGSNIDHMIAALCAAADDDGPTLVQRHLLDFLCSAFPLNSDHLVREDFVQLLRRCLFLVLRRDMSLNRRLYQWLLNRVGDSAVAGLPIAGADENFDVTFFKTYALPITKKAVEEYLNLNTVEVASGVAAWDGTKEHQLQFTEVRVCRLLLYFLDRPEIGHLMLNEMLPMLLEHASKYDARISKWMKEEEENLGKGVLSMPSSSKTTEDFTRRQSVGSRCSIGSRHSRLSTLSSSEETKCEQEKRVSDFNKTVNLLMNSLDAGYLWNFLARKLKTLLLQKNAPVNGNVDPNTITNESKMLKEECEMWAAQELENFPRVTLFCLKTIDLDTHGDIRDQYLPQLLSSVLTAVAEKNVASMSCQLIIELLNVSRAILEHMNHGEVVTDTTDATIASCLRGDAHDVTNSMDADFTGQMSLRRGIKEQWRVENCLSDCHRLLAQICDWYCKERNTERLRVFHAALSLMRAFAEFPLYDLSAHEKIGLTRRQRYIPTSHAIWISGLLNVMSLDDWSSTLKQKCQERSQKERIGDFHARADSLDLIINVYMRSISSVELLQAVIGRKRRSFQSDQDKGDKKTSTTTILVKPMLTEGDLIRIDEDGFFKKAAEVLWCCLGEDSYTAYHTKTTRLLILLHSRKSSEPSSDVEELIVNHLTCNDRVINGLAAKKFRTMWMLNRPSSGSESCMGTMPSKPFNRVIMLLLSFLSDDSIGYDRAELKSISDAWFNDCARHNDLPFILQMWATMLLNPSTTRVSIQYLMMHCRISREQIPSMPPGLCCITLLTEGGRQSLHHLCEDISKPAVADAKYRLSEISPAIDECRSGTEHPQWFNELRNRLLQEGDPESTTLDVSAATDARSHRRTVSDIPIFDDDNESVGTASIESLDHGIAEAVQYLVDTVCAEEEVKSSELHFFMGENKLHDSSPQTTTSDAQESTLETESKSDVHLQTPGTSVDYSGMEAQLSSPTQSKNRSENISSSAENVKRKGHRRQDSLQETIFSMSAQELKLFDTELPRLNAAGDDVQPLCHELHAHMLLYAESGHTVDLARSEKVLRMLIALLRTQRGFEGSRLILSCMVSSGTASSSKYTCCPASTQLIDLLTRHVRAILGHDFWATYETTEGSSPTDANRSKHYTFLELFITVSLYFLRSYFLNSPTACVSDTDLRNAWKCKMAALDFLSELLRELIAMISEHQSRAMVTYIYNIVQRSKLQKCVLHLLLTSVHSLRSFFPDIAPLSVDIIEFNDGLMSLKNQFGDLIAGYQRSLLDLTAVVIQLEMVMKNGFQDYPDQDADSLYLEKLSINQQIYNSPQHRLNMRDPPYGMVELRMLLLTVVNALKRNPVRQEQWFTFILRILPFLDRSLPLFSIHIVEQLCKNLENAICAAYKCSDIHSTREVFNKECDEQQTAFPSNYAVNVLETLMAYIHYCLIDTSSAAASRASIAGSQQASQAVAASNQSLASSVMNAIPGTKGATELFTNLVKVFSFSDSTSVPSNNGLNKYASRGTGDGLRQARIEIINTFPHVLSTVCDTWTHLRGGEPNIPTGCSVQLRKLILDLVSPLVQHQQQSFLSSLALVWMTRNTVTVQKQFTTRIEPDQPSFAYSPAQLDIAELILSIDVLPFENLIVAVTDAMKECAYKSVRSNAPTEKQNTFPTELALLEMLHGCVRTMPPSALLGCWHPLQVLFTETPVMNLPPRAVFLQFIILADFVQMAGSSTIVEDKQMSRAAQDACQKLTEAVNVIVGWQLEQTTWLKRTLVVKHDSNAQKSQETSPVAEFATAPTSIAASENNSLRGSTASLIQSRLPAFDTATQLTSASQASSAPTASMTDKKGNANLKPSLKDPNNPKRDPAHSTQALFLLAEHLTELIDSICKSEDKERLLPLLHSVWNNTLPYLKAKNARNARFFLASSHLLASMSTFNYMRPVWRKATLDLLLDPAFFKMDIQSLKHWLVVTDHLMTHDKTSFKELLARISTTQNSTLSSLITSKEAEYEMRAQALKRLAFIVLSSEVDQYQAQLPDIQERLSDNLRLSQVPIVHAQVFLCYRVLLIRLKPLHLVSMWPSMVTELVHVLLQIEQQLSGSTNVSDDLKCDRNDQWMQLYLAACKLLETLCTLPSGYLAQFQMCHWAFVNSVAASGAGSFVPFASRIDRLLRNKFGQLSPHDRKLLSASLVSMKTLTNFGELRPFFLALATQNKTITFATQSSFDKDDHLRDAIYLNGSLSYKAAVSRLKHALYIDFAEHWQL